MISSELYARLLTKGYNGLQNFIDVLDWFDLHQIYISYRLDINNTSVGYVGIAEFPPFSCKFTTEVHLTRSNALENILFVMTEFI